MKNLLRAAILAQLLASLAMANGGETTLVSLKEFLPRLAHTGRTIGLETVLMCRDKVSVQKVEPLVEKRDLAALAKVVEEDTDYKCILGVDYMIVFPKEAPGQYDRPMILRQVTFPSAKGLSQDGFYGQIHAVDVGEPVEMTGYPLVSPFLVKNGRIEISGGSSVCYAVLNRMAVQLNSGFWWVDHTFLIPRGQSHPQLPVKLSFGWLAFEK